jgi:hypothetical protein
MNAPATPWIIGSSPIMTKKKMVVVETIGVNP